MERTNTSTSAITSKPVSNPAPEQRNLNDVHFNVYRQIEWQAQQDVLPAEQARAVICVFVSRGLVPANLPVREPSQERPEQSESVTVSECACYSVSYVDSGRGSGVQGSICSGGTAGFKRASGPGGQVDRLAGVWVPTFVPDHQPAFNGHDFQSLLLKPCCCSKRDQKKRKSYFGAVASPGKKVANLFSSHRSPGDCSENPPAPRSWPVIWCVGRQSPAEAPIGFLPKSGGSRQGKYEQYV